MTTCSPVGKSKSHPAKHYDPLHPSPAKGDDQICYHFAHYNYHNDDDDDTDDNQLYLPNSTARSHHKDITEWKPYR